MFRGRAVCIMCCFETSFGQAGSIHVLDRNHMSLNSQLQLMNCLLDALIYELFVRFLYSARAQTFPSSTGVEICF